MLFILFPTIILGTQVEAKRKKARAPITLDALKKRYERLNYEPIKNEKKIRNLLDDAVQSSDRDVHAWAKSELRNFDLRLTEARKKRAGGEEPAVPRKEAAALQEQKTKHALQEQQLVEYSEKEVVDEMVFPTVDPTRQLSLEARKLSYHIRWGNISELQKLFAEQPDLLDARALDFNDTPLIYAIDNGRLNVADFLIMSGADVNVQGRDGRTALDVAMNRLNPDAIELLLKNNAVTRRRKAFQNNAVKIIKKIKEWEGTPIGGSLQKQITDFQKIQLLLEQYDMIERRKR